MNTSFAAHGDMPLWLIVASIALTLVTLALLVRELSTAKRMRNRLAVGAVGVLLFVLLLLAILRPVRVTAHETTLLPRVLVLIDSSRSMALPRGGGLRMDTARTALEQLRSTLGKDARFATLQFGSGPASAVEHIAEPVFATSDFTSALQSVGRTEHASPDALIVISDGRFSDPSADKPLDASFSSPLKGIPIHTVAVETRAPRDAQVRRADLAGTAVAHVPMPLRIELGCTGGLLCTDVPISVRELRDDGEPTTIATGTATVKDDRASLELSVTLNRAGTHLLEVSIKPPEGDTIAENNRRIVPVLVKRERVRILHIAGRATHDVRTLRDWLKADASVDLVSFFILRTPTDDAKATVSELALIEFPVDELFTTHLPSFDAVILQDFDAQPYGFEKHLPNLASYVRRGGGLVMIGGPNSFVAGGYANTALANVLPVTLDGSRSNPGADPSEFIPTWTAEGRVAPLLDPIRNITDYELPPMPGTNILGDAHPAASVLWTHPSRRTASGAPMPVLAVSDVESGRSIALGVDGGWLLQFSDVGVKTGGRGHGALWDGLLGWLMRDPRFEALTAGMAEPCIAQIPSTLAIRTIPGFLHRETEPVAIDLVRLDGAKAPAQHFQGTMRADQERTLVSLPPLPSGGYSAIIRLGQTTAVRYEFACESGGDEWADPRPAAEHLVAIAKATGGTHVSAADITSLPMPKGVPLVSQRSTRPLAPAWVWALSSALVAGIFWWMRRERGLR